MAKYSEIDIVDDPSISRVGAWKNKDEFNLVYDWIFGSESNDQTKRLALRRMKVWKIRRSNLTPASVLSTLSILEIQLKDQINTELSIDELRAMYSTAFTRFLNYMSSIMRSRQLQSMYSTARELGIESFLVDLRHLCAHGQVIPSLQILQRTADYCLNWLRTFYWDRERNFITDANVKDVHLKDSAELQQSVSDWFNIYDAATEAIINHCKTIDDLKNTELSGSHIELLTNFSIECRNDKLLFIANKAINQLAQLSNSNERDRGNAHIYCDVLLELTNFMERSAQYYDSVKSEQTKFIGIHQNLFRLFAICDFINVMFMRLLYICEDELEEDFKRKAASFWSNEIATGFLVFKEFKNVYKAKKEKNAKFDVDMAPINTDVMTDDLKKIYKELHVNYQGTLIFGDTVRRPWALQFDRDFLIERATNINQYTVEPIQKCVRLIEPALDDGEAQYVKKLISIYMEQSSSKLNQSEIEMDDDSKVFTLEEYLAETSEATESMTENDKNVNDATSDSIWREAPDGINWKSCPIGEMP